MQPQSSQEALSQLQTFQSSRRKPQDVLRERETQLGVPTSQQRLVGLRGAISNTENLIKNVDPSVSGRTQGSLVTEAQKSRLINMEREPLASQFTEQNRALEGETANMNELSRRALQDAQLQISADDAQQNSLQGLYGMLYQREQDETARREREAAERQQADYLKRILDRDNPPNPTPTPEANTGNGLDPNQVKAYQDVQTRLKGSPQQIMSDYLATLKSANFGNVMDKIKVQLYHRERPDLFGGANPLGGAMRAITEAENFKYGKLADPAARNKFLAELAR